MLLFIGKACIILMYVVCSLCEDIQHVHKEQLLGNVECNDTDNDHCDTITTGVDVENTTELSNSTTIGEGEAGTTVNTEADDTNITTDIPDITVFPSSSAIPPVSSTSTVKPTTEPSYEMHFIPEDICTCDLTVEYCDINCCCDEDCTASDRQAFSHCFRRPPITPDPLYCYQTNFVYRNNTEYKMIQNKEGLFCILWDNLPSEVRYMHKKVVTNLKDFKKFFERRQFYQWPTPVSSGPVFQPTMYRAGSTVWSISNTTIAPLALPNMLVTAFCEISTPIQYLIDWSGSCSARYLDCTAESGLSASYYYGNFHLISTPHLMNYSHVMYFLEQQECLYNVCIPFNLFVCSLDTNDVEDCLPVDEIEDPIYDNETDVCSNVVKKLKYRLFHNGTLGIVSAEAFFWIIDLKSTQIHLSQTFSVDFMWIDAPRRPFRRSGNPGYIVGKPVIAGQKVYHISESENVADKEAILLSEEQSRWLTLPKAALDSLCINSMAEGNRLPVNFGENLWSSCFLEFFASNFSSAENCSSVQRKIHEILLGDVMINVTDPKQFNMYVSTFGDANVQETGNWVPVLLENMPILSVGWKQEGTSWSCKDVVTSLHMNIVTSKIGLATKPQNKIIGVAVSFSAVRDLVFNCAPKPCSNIYVNEKQKFEIKSSVSFLDVSKAPVLHFAEPPVYEVKLPYDFFYPFLSSSSARAVICPFVVMLTLFFSCTHKTVALL